MPVHRRLLIPLLLLFFSACATQEQNAISVPPPLDLSLAEVRSDIPAHLNQRVRWGGSIAGVENRASETWLEIVARPLNSSGRPSAGDESFGRFIAKVKGFLDPAVYATGRLVTVAGIVGGGLTRTIGEYPYTYLVIDADTIKLWERPMEAPYYYSSPFYDPYSLRPLNPWYPWYSPYPYYLYGH